MYEPVNVKGVGFLQFADPRAAKAAVTNCKIRLPADPAKGLEEGVLRMENTPYEWDLLEYNSLGVKPEGPRHARVSFTNEGVVKDLNLGYANKLYHKLVIPLGGSSNTGGIEFKVWKGENEQVLSVKTGQFQ